MLLSVPDIPEVVKMKGRLQEVPRGGMHTKVVGSTFAAGLIDDSLIAVGVVLCPVYDNAYDEYAIEVLRGDDGTRIGYLRAAYTHHLQPFLEAHGLSAIVLGVTGGTPDKPLRGVNLYVYATDGTPLPSKEWMLGAGRRAS